MLTLEQHRFLSILQTVSEISEVLRIRER